MATEELNDPKTKKFIKYLLGLPHNSRCADCGKNSPAWCAWTYGFFVCYECAGQHRKLGPGASRVKNATMDAWSEEELRRMYVGGNKFAYKIPHNPDITLKYRDCHEFVAELDCRCELSEAKEPGDSFMNTERRPSASGFGSAVIRKKSVPKFSDRAPKKPSSDSAESEQDSDSCAVRAPIAKEKPTEVACVPSDVALLSRRSKELAKLPSNIEKSRSPFSFKPDSQEEDCDSD